MKIVLVTGGFDPIHSGHIEYLKAAKQLGDKLLVGINSDGWLERKKGKAFMPSTERTQIIRHLEMVDNVFLFDDTDGSALEAINDARLLYPEAHIIFANGGDRTSINIPEMSHTDQNLSFEFSVGGADKKNSSSWILTEWKSPKTIRNWGWYRVLDDQPQNGFKVKELVIEPGKSLSDQRHFKRSEMWYVLKGTVSMVTVWEGRSEQQTLKALDKGYDIKVGTWHKASNPGTDLAHILEVQYGEACVEEDIERR